MKEIISLEQAQAKLREARLDFQLARTRYLITMSRVEKLLYKKDRPALLRRQAE